MTKDSYNEKLTRVYVALAMAQNATKRWVDEKPEYSPLRGLVTTLDVTTKLLEEILQTEMPEGSDVMGDAVSIEEMTSSYSEMIM